MSQSAIKIVKPIDSNRHSSGSIAPTANEREFWIEQRHALLMQLTSIERRLGLKQTRCRHCKTRTVEPIESSG